MAQRVTKHTSDICGCVTWYTWDDAVSEDARVHADIAISPCAIHDAANVGKTLLSSQADAVAEEAVRRSSMSPVTKFAGNQGARVKDIVPLLRTISQRREMHNREEVRAALMAHPDLGEDYTDQNTRQVVRRFKRDPDFRFGADRKLVVDLRNAPDEVKAAALAVLTAMGGDRGTVV